MTACGTHYKEKLKVGENAYVDFYVYASIGYYTSKDTYYSAGDTEFFDFCIDDTEIENVYNENGEEIEYTNEMDKVVNDYINNLDEDYFRWNC